MAGETNRRELVLSIALLVLVVGSLVATAWVWNLRTAAMGLLAAILSSMVPLVCHLRGIAAQRHCDLFYAIENQPLGKTAYARIARQYFDGLSRGRLLSSAS